MIIKEYNMSRNKNVEYDGLIYEFDAIPELNIFLPFQLYIPYDMKEGSDLIVACRTPNCSTGTFEESLEKAKEIAINPISRKLSSAFKNPMLMPVIPRCIALDTTYLGYSVYHQDYSDALRRIENGTLKFTESDLHKFDNLDEQVKKND